MLVGQAALASQSAGHREIQELGQSGQLLGGLSQQDAAAGVEDGIVQGKATAEGAAFQGEEPITFNEAATVLNRMLNLGDVDLDVWYADREAVPSWAAQAVGNMEAFSVLSAGSFGSKTMEQAVTRADAAQMLSAASTLLAGEEPEGLFGWLQ